MKHRTRAPRLWTGWLGALGLLLLVGGGGSVERGRWTGVAAIVIGIVIMAVAIYKAEEVDVR